MFFRGWARQKKFVQAIKMALVKLLLPYIFLSAALSLLQSERPRWFSRFATDRKGEKKAGRRIETKAARA